MLIVLFFLTTTFNIWSYAKDVESVSESLVKGLESSNKCC